jgi:hypothetical protein
MTDKDKDNNKQQTTNNKQQTTNNKQQQQQRLRLGWLFAHPRPKIRTWGTHFLGGAGEKQIPLRCRVSSFCASPSKGEEVY